MELEEFLQNYNFITIVTFLVLFIAVVQKIYDWFKWVKDRLSDYYNKKRGVEKKEDGLEKRLANLEENDKSQKGCLETILNAQAEMKEILLDTREQSRQNEVASNRYILYEIAEKVNERGFITPVEYETFSELANRYISQGGNHIMKEKVIPKIKELPIKEDTKGGI